MKKINNILFFILFALTLNAQFEIKNPTNVRFIAGGYTNQSPFFDNLEDAVNDILPYVADIVADSVITSDETFIFWLIGDTLLVSDWLDTANVIGDSVITWRDSVNSLVSRQFVRWGGNLGQIEVYGIPPTPQNTTTYYNLPVWGNLTPNYPWQDSISTAISDIDEILQSLIVYTADPLYIENDTLRMKPMITNFKYGTLASPPVVDSAEVWADTTDSALYPLLRIGR
jgi:hypothetical protein